MWLIPSHWWAYGKAKRVFISARNSSEIRWKSGEWGEQGSGHVYMCITKSYTLRFNSRIIEFAHRNRDCQQHTRDLWGWNPRSLTVNLPSDTDVFPCHASRGSRILRPHCTQKVHLLLILYGGSTLLEPSAWARHKTYGLTVSKDALF